MPIALIQFLAHYKYFALLPAAIIEGPITAVVAGLLMSLGYLSLVPTFIVVLIGDIASDTAFYWMGWHGRNNLSRIKFVKVPEKVLLELEGRFRDKPKRTIAIAKASYGLGAVFMVGAGASQMPFGRFMFYTITSTAVKGAALLALGFYFGRALGHFNEYLQYYALLILILVPTGFYLARRMRQWRRELLLRDEIKTGSDV